MTHCPPVWIGFAFLLLALTWLAAPSSLAAEQGTPPPAALGEWKIRLETPRGFATPTLRLAREGKMGFKGVMQGPRGTSDLKSVKLEGDTFEFQQRVTHPVAGDISMKFSGVVDGKKMTGTVKTPRGERAFTGKRVERKPKAATASGQ